MPKSVNNIELNAEISAAKTHYIGHSYNLMQL